MYMYMYLISSEYSEISEVFQKLMVKNNNNSKIVMKYIQIQYNSNAVVYFSGSTFNTGR